MKVGILNSKNANTKFITTAIISIVTDSAASIIPSLRVANADGQKKPNHYPLIY